MYALPIILLSAWSKHFNVLEKGFTLQVDSVHYLDPWHMIYMNFQIHNLYALLVVKV